MSFDNFLAFISLYFKSKINLNSKSILGGLSKIIDFESTSTIFSLTWNQGNTQQDTNYTATYLPSWKLSKLDEPDTQDTAGEAGTNLSVMYSYGLLHVVKQKQDDQLEHIFSSYVSIQDVALNTCLRWWTIGRSVERGSGKWWKLWSELLLIKQEVTTVVIKFINPV